MNGFRTTALMQSPAHMLIQSIIRSVFIFSIVLGLSACFEKGGGGGSQGGGTAPSVAANTVLIAPGDTSSAYAYARAVRNID